MPQRDVLAELRTATVEAPPELRERVRLIAARAPAERRPTWRRLVLFALAPATVAAAAAVVGGRPRHTAVASGSPARCRRHLPGARRGADEKSAAQPCLVRSPPARGRAQSYNATIDLRVHDVAAVSDAVKRALAIAASLGGYPAAVHVVSTSRHGTRTSCCASRGSACRRRSGGSPRSARSSASSRPAGRPGRGQHHRSHDRAPPAPADDAARRAADRRDAAADRALTPRIVALAAAAGARPRAAHYATVRVNFVTPAAEPCHHKHSPSRLGTASAGRERRVYALALGVRSRSSCSRCARRAHACSAGAWTRCSGAP